MANDPLKTDRETYDGGDIDYAKLRRVRLRRPAGTGALSTFAVRLEGEVIEQLRQVAADNGVGPTQLVRQWILERLDTERQGETASHETRSLGGLSRDELAATLRPLVREIMAEELNEPAKRPPAPARPATAKKAAGAAKRSPQRQ